MYCNQPVDRTLFSRIAMYSSSAFIICKFFVILRASIACFLSKELIDHLFKLVLDNYIICNL